MLNVKGTSFALGCAVFHKYVMEYWWQINWASAFCEWRRIWPLLLQPWRVTGLFVVYLWVKHIEIYKYKQNPTINMFVMNRIVWYHFSWLTCRHLVWAVFSVAGLCTLEVKHHAGYSSLSLFCPKPRELSWAQNFALSSTEADAHPASPCSTARERLVDSLMWQWHLQLWNSVPMGVWKHKPAERGSWMI